MAARGASPEGPGTSSAASPRDLLFTQFSEATDIQSILRLFKELCEEISVDYSQYEGFYDNFKAAFTSWKAKGLFQLFDGRSKHAEYCNQQACAGKRVLVVGAGPVGLRGAIEAAFLGAKVDLVEKRTAFNRNNSLHLWPFLVNDLKTLGAKKFYGRFCSSTIDHISIKVLQCILLRTCLILGVKVHVGTTFDKLLEPSNNNSGWTVKTTPSSCPIGSYYFDMIIGADGKQNSLPGFLSKEFRAKLALAITVNFVNGFTKKEASVPEISGVAFVYRQDFFNNLATKHGIDLENIVYYKDETHYFVMTAKKASLLNKKVIKKDYNDPAELLAKGNIDRKYLEQYAREATCYATEGELKDLPFEKNHRGENDVALFDFTSLFASVNAARIIERKGKRILLCLAGDSLLEPFWPTGTGCARGFHGVFDAAWMMKRFCRGDDPLEILEERESILYLLPQTTPERMQKNFAAYTIDPKTRYMFLSEALVPEDISHLYDTDDKNALQLSRNQSLARSSMKTKHRTSVSAQRSQSVRNKSPLPKGNPPAPIIIPTSSKRDQRQTRSASPPSVSSGQALAKPVGEKTGQDKHPRSKWRSVISKMGRRRSGSPEVLPEKDKEVKESSKLSKQQSVSASGKSSSIQTEDEGKPQGNVRDRIKSFNDKDASVKPEEKLATAKNTSKRETRSVSPIASKSPSEESKPDHEESKATPSRWSILRSKFRRARSASPERSKEKEKRASFQGKTKCQLETTASANPVEEEKAKSKVSDRIKEFNRRDESVKYASTSKGDKAEATAPSTSISAEEAGESKGKDKAIAKDKGKKTKKDKKESEEKLSKKAIKKEGKSWGLFRKPHKGKGQVVEHDGMESTDGPLGVDDTVAEKLREQELADAAGTTKVELISVAQNREESVCSPEASSLEGGEIGGPDEVDFGGHGPEIRLPLSGQAPTGEVVRGASGGGGGDDKPVKPSTRVKDHVQKIQVSIETTPPSVKRSLSLSTSLRSKEIDLSDLRGQSQAPPSDPLWKVKKTKALSKCLERLRKENGEDVQAAKTTMEILLAIFKNVKNYPDNDVFRRVRVSSKLFQTKVWSHAEAKKFIARSGWMQIDDFIVLPMGTPVELPLKVLKKHLEIINQMLWSKQLDITDSPATVIKRVQANKKARSKPAPFNKRDSYATMLVEESMDKIMQEEDKRAVEAAHVRRNTADASVLKRSQSPPVAMEIQTVVEEENTTVDQKQSRKQEELQTIKAATEARKIWESRDDENKVQSMEEQLYGKKMEDSITEGQKYVRSSYRRDSSVDEKIKMFGANSSRSVSNTSLKTAALSDLVLMEEDEDTLFEDDQEVVSETDKTLRNFDDEGKIIEEKVASCPDSKDSPKASSVQDTSVLQKLGKNVTASSSKALSSSPSSSGIPTTDKTNSNLETPETNGQFISEDTLKEDQSSVSAEISANGFSLPEVSTETNATNSTSLVAGNGSCSNEEEKLTTLPQQFPTSESNGPTDKTEEKPAALSVSATSQQLKLLTQASRSTAVKDKKEEPSTSTAKSDKLEYEKVAMEAAALTREKWKQTEK